MHEFLCVVVLIGTACGCMGIRWHIYVNDVYISFLDIKFGRPIGDRLSLILQNVFSRLTVYIFKQLLFTERRTSISHSACPNHTYELPSPHITRNRVKKTTT